MDLPMQPKKIGRPTFPEDYGIPNHNEGLLPVSYIAEHMCPVKNYWIVTATRQGKPAATPVWGVWLDGKLYFDGSPSTRRGRNIRHNSQVTVHLESGDEVLVLEGEAIILSTAPEPALAIRLAQAYTAKYERYGYAPMPDNWDKGGLFIFTPKSAMGWTQFPKDVTRWEF